MRDLLVATHTPVLGSGQAVRTYGVARALAAHRPLTLLYTRFGASEPDAAFAGIDGIELREVVPSRSARRVSTYARARMAGVPAGFARGISAELADAAGVLAGERDRGRVIADGPIAAAALGALARRRPVIYNAHNLESGFRGELSDVSRGETRRLRRFERGLLERASESWMVSHADLDGARALCPDANLRYAPNVVDVTAIEPVVPRSEDRRAIFVASFVYEPNRNGVRFLLDDVFPRVWRELPNARLALVGGGLEPDVASDARVEVRGFVEDLPAEYARADCALVPLLQGGGTPLKLIEALAYALPVVATPRAVAGLELEDGRDCLIADGAERFAAAIVRVLREGVGDLGAAGRAVALERYSIEALSSLLAP